MGMIRRCQQVFAYIQRNRDAIICRNTRLYTGREQTWPVGTLQGVPGKTPKLVNAWQGLYSLVAHPVPVLVNIKPANHEGRTIRVQITCLREYHGNPRKTIAGTVDADDKDFEAEEIRTGSSLPAELGIQVHSGVTGMQILDKTDAAKDAAEEEVQLLAAPLGVQDAVLTDEELCLVASNAAEPITTSAARHRSGTRANDREGPGW